MVHYYKSYLIILCIVLFIVCCWVFEWILLISTGTSTSKLIDPLQDLSIIQLQALLEGRGIQYSTLVEKAEIVEAIQKSGNVQYMELLSVTNSVKSNGPVEIFGKDDLYEQVLEESESIWLVEIIAGEGYRLLDDSTWKQLDRKLKLVGINTAVVKCYKDPSLCSTEGWNHPQLIMSVPRNDSNFKRALQIPSSHHSTVNSIMKWINHELSKLTERILTTHELDSVWLNSSSVTKNKIPRMIYITEFLNPPLLLVAVGLRFSSRIRMAILSVGRTEKEQVLKSLKRHKLNGPPVLVLSTPDSVLAYGNSKGEVLSITALETYIKVLQPRTNDIFLASLFLANFLALVHLIDYRGSWWRCVVLSLFRVPAYNVAVFIAWLTLTAIFRFPWTAPLLDTGSEVWGKINSTFFSGIVVYYYLLIGNFNVLVLLICCKFAVLVYLYRRFFGERRGDTESDSWSLFSMDSYLVNVLFRPMDSLSRQQPSQDLGLEEGMELLIERLATPDLWLYPVVFTDYIKELPCWRYDGWGNEEDLKSESETDFDSLSENENEALMASHQCCQDDSCKMCALWTTVKETYVCHRCAILKRKLEKKFLWYRNVGNSAHQNSTYEKLIKVCENCSRTKRNQPPSITLSHTKQERSKKQQWFIRVHELKWTAPGHAIESRICAICLDRYRWSAVLCGLPCGHTYHHSCVMEWLSKDNHHCPTCRWPSYRGKAIQ